MVGQSKLSANMLPHEKVTQLVRRYTKGQTRIGLEKLGVGWLNRSVSWKYVHSKLREILEVEGFSAFRYKVCIAVEPDDNDLFASTRRTEEEVKRADGMLPDMGCQP